MPHAQERAAASVSKHGPQARCALSTLRDGAARLLRVRGGLALFRRHRAAHLDAVLGKPRCASAASARSLPLRLPVVVVFAFQDLERVHPGPCRSHASGAALTRIRETMRLATTPIGCQQSTSSSVAGSGRRPTDRGRRFAADTRSASSITLTRTSPIWRAVPYSAVRGSCSSSVLN